MPSSNRASRWHVSVISAVDVYWSLSEQTNRIKSPLILEALNDRALAFMLWLSLWHMLQSSFIRCGCRMVFIASWPKLSFKNDNSDNCLGKGWGTQFVLLLSSPCKAAQPFAFTKISSISGNTVPGQIYYLELYPFRYVCNGSMYIHDYR